jgi:hypothetical protein
MAPQKHPTLSNSTLRWALAAALFSCGIAHAEPTSTAVLTPHTRDAPGIASAVTELLPAIGDCLDSDRVLGGPAHMRVLIAFNVIESGEVGDLIIDGIADRIGTSTLPGCLEGTLAAMRFAPGARAIPVQLPLEATAQTQSTTN